MIEWTEVDPQHFETYPSPKPVKGPDDIDAVIALVAAGKTVEITLADEKALRGRRMAMGRRAKQQGLTLDMRYQGNKIIVRQRGSTEVEQSEQSEQSEQLDQLEQLERPATPRASRKRT